MSSKPFHWGLLALSLALGACAAPPDDDSADFVASDGSDDGKADGAGAAPGQTIALAIDDGAFPAAAGRPNVVVYIPSGFDSSQPLEVVVFLHGWLNCASNVVRAKNGVCVAGHPARNAYNLANQLEASRRNAILVVPELAFEQSTGDPGRLAEDGLFATMMSEVLDQLGDKVGGQSVADLDQLVVVSHSGGYQSAAAIATVGGLAVSELYLLDSLYGNEDDFDGWINSDDNHDGFAPAPFTRRFASVYTTTGGTLASSRAMADRARAWFSDGSAFLDDRTTHSVSDAQLGHGLVFKYTSLVHDDVPRYYFGRLIATSALPDKP